MKERKMTNSFLENVYGYSLIKRELKTIQDWYFNCDKTDKRKRLLPKGLLFYGMPGAGKTHIVREYSKSFNYPVFVIEGNSDNLESEIISCYEKARKETNAIVIIDEIDHLVNKSERITRVLQTQLDGLDNNESILTLATANNLFDLPESLRREGRFDREFLVSLKDKSDLKDILKGFSKDTYLNFSDDGIDELSDNLKRTPISKIKLSFATACLKYPNGCSIDELLKIIDFVKSGSLENDIESIPFQACIHEAGHALYLRKYCKNKKFLRIYFDKFGGTTVYKDLNNQISLEERLEHLRGCLAGLVAEELLMGYHDIGSHEDIEEANDIAFQLLNRDCIYKIDLYCRRSELQSNGKISNYRIENFDKRVSKFLIKNYKLVKRQLKKYIKEIKKTAEYLLKNKSINNSQLSILLDENNKSIY